MLKKRILGVITVKNGKAVQSFGYKKYLPIGDPSLVAENLDRFGIDEILIQSIDRSRNELGPDFNLIKKINKLKISTPLIYSGGINKISHARQVINQGIERVALDALFFINPKLIFDITNILGKQAVILSIPVGFKNKIIQSYNYLADENKDILKLLDKYFHRGMFSEVLLIDYKNEGNFNAFDLRLIDAFNEINDIPLITFGGITEGHQIRNILNKKNVNSVGIGNSLSYKEHSVQVLKNNIDYDIFRPSFYDDYSNEVLKFF